MTAKPTVIARLVAFSAARPWAVTIAALALGALAMSYSVSHFAMTTDTDKLISAKLPFRQREAQYNKLFPEQGDQVVVVIDGKTPELAEQGAADLAAKLAAKPDQFPFVDRPDASPFFQQNGLLFASLADVQSAMSQLITAQPFLGPLAADPSVRGLMGSLSTATEGVTTGAASLDKINRPIKGPGRHAAAAGSRQAGLFLVARADQHRQAGSERAAPCHPGRPQAGLQRPGTRRQGQRCHPSICPRPEA